MPRDNGIGPDTWAPRMKWSVIVFAIGLVVAVTMNYAALFYHTHQEYITRSEAQKDIEAVKEKLDMIYEIVMRQYGRPEP